MIQKLRDLLAAPPDDDNLFLSLGVGCLFFGAWSIYPPAGYCIVGVIFIAVGVIQGRAA